jgi:hypothetical protein
MGLRRTCEQDVPFQATAEAPVGGIGAALPLNAVNPEIRRAGHQSARATNAPGVANVSRVSYLIPRGQVPAAM